MSRRRRSTLAASLALVAALTVVGLPSATLAQDAYTLVTEASYSVLPDEREVAVSVQVEFTNTTPDPPGQFSVFEVIDLAIHAGATDVTARDGEGDLTVNAEENDDGVNVASVRPRSPVRHEQAASFTLSYVIPDGASEDVRIRPSIVIFPAWSFGTGGSVSVSVPVSYEVLTDGDELTAERDGDAWRLESGEVEDPTHWLALVTAVHPDAYATLNRGVPLESGTVDLQVRHWTDDEAWGEQTAALLEDGLPALEETLGVGYRGVGPLVVVESLPRADGGFGEPSEVEGVDLAVSFRAAPFAVLHQATHVFIDEGLAAERWMREGFASWAAAAVAGGLEAEPPFDPAERREELSDDAFPLISWGAGEASIGQDAYAYAASWAVVGELAEALGQEGVRTMLARVAAGMNPYEPVAATPPEPGGREPVPLDSRRLLDHAENVAGEDLSGIFREAVFDEATVARLEERAAARAAYAALLEAAGEWGGPAPVQAALAGWRFDEAEQRIEEAAEWLEGRDALLKDAERAGLAVPARLRDQWATGGGGVGARTELEAERAVVDAYAAAIEREREDRSILERIGLLGGPDPGTQLAQAHALFSDGELRGALDAVQEASTRLEHAGGDGILRLVSFMVVLFALGAGVTFLVLRRREEEPTVYTAAP